MARRHAATTPRAPRQNLRAVRMLCLGLAAAGLAASGAWANPTGGRVTGGDATIVEDGARLDVHQTSARAIIDWRGFSIDRGETTRFHQPSRHAVALNRVTGADPSRIFGSLLANGQIFLVNPNGILFGAGARVDVAGLLATTSDIRDEDFLAGRYDFGRPSPDPDARVVNEGDITVAESGYAALVAPAVRNAGTITARLGRVTLGGAEAFALDLYGDNLIAFRAGVTRTPHDAAGDPVTALVQHDGAILADGGRVVLAAENLGAVVQSAVNLDGVVQANSIARRGGEIVIDAAGAGGVTVAGRLEAQGDADGERGGRIQVTGETVTLASGAALDASGRAGGGEVLVGGNYQGGGAERSARETLVAAGATIRADAQDDGDGGRVIVWADETTRYYGDISATGGAGGGDGGFVEVSGKERLAFAGTVDLGAPHGAAGTLLLDPVDIVVSDADNADGANGGSILSGDAPGAEPWNVSPAALDGIGANIVLQATNDITFTDALTLTTAGASLTATAGNAINVDNVVTTNGGDVTLSGATVAIAAAGDVVTNGGDVSISASLANTGIAGITMLAGSTIDAGSGRIDLLASSSGLSLQQVTTTSAATADGAEAIHVDFLGPLTFNDTVSANGNIVVQPSVAGVGLTMGGAGLANLLAGNELIIGRVDGTGLLKINATTFNSALRIRNNAGIQIQGTITNNTAGGATTLDPGAGDVLLRIGGGGTAIDNNGGDIVLLGDLDLDGNAYSLLSGGGNVRLQGIVDSSGTGSDLTVTAGAGTYRSTGADLGAAAGVLTVTASTIEVLNSLIADTAALNGAASGGGLDVRALTLTGASAALTGTVNGKSGDLAAAEAAMPDSPDHRINNCSKSQCFNVTPDPDPVPQPTPDPDALDTVFRLTTPEGGGATLATSGGATAPVGTDSVSGDGDAGGWLDGGSDPLAGDPLMSPTAGLRLRDFRLRLGDGEMEERELLETAEGAGDPELTALTEDLLLLLGETEFALASAVPSDAFNGAAAVILPGLVRFEPTAEDGDALDVVFQPSGFAVYQF